MKKKILHILFTCLALLSIDLSAQNANGSIALKKKIDSLKQVLNSSISDSNKLDLYQNLYSLTDSMHYAEKGLVISESLNSKKNIAQFLLDIGRSHYFAGKEDVSLTYLIRSVKIAEELDFKKVLISDYRYIGFIYRPHEPYKAIEYYEKSLKLCDELGNELEASYSLSAIGNVYEGVYDPSKTNTKKALEYYLKSLSIREKKGSPSEIASSLNETSRTYDVLGEYARGLEYKLRGLQLAEKANDPENVVYLCNQLGNTFSDKLKDYNTALRYELKAYDIGRSRGNNFEVLLDISSSIAKCYKEMGDLKNSNDFFLIGLSYNDSIRNKAKRYDYNLSGLKQGLEKELEKQKLLVKDAEILKEKAEKQNLTIIRNAFIIVFVLLLLFGFYISRAYRQKQKANEELDKRNQEIEKAYTELAISEGKFKQITETISDVFYLYNIVDKKYEYINAQCEVLFGVGPDFFYTGKSMKGMVHKDDLAKVIDANVKVDSGISYDIEYRIIVHDQLKWVAEKSSPIFDEKGKLIRNSGICRDITRRKIAEEFLHKKNKDISDSIEYASKIQKALLTPQEKIAAKLKEFFILFKPKDIVSGDFYFFTESDKGIIIAAGDCTGHGVSAGFMSMIGTAFLNEIVNTKGITTPAEILNQLRKMIIESLNQNIHEADANDGIDIALLYFDKNNHLLEYAGAFNSLYLVRNKELQEIKADLFPVGISFAEKQVAFKNNKIELQKGDSLYIFSDGYADQFGGPQGKKFKKKTLQELFLEIQDRTMADQEKILSKKFDEWKGKLDQVDDVLIIGIKV